MNSPSPGMVRRWLLPALLPLLVLLIMVGLRRTPGAPPPGMWSEMGRSPAYRSQSAAPALPAGTAMRAPAPGALARDGEHFLFGEGDDERARAGRLLGNPVPLDTPNLIEGAEIFNIFCQTCHGTAGAGDGPVVPPFPNPPDLRLSESSGQPDGALYHTITRGRNKMSSFAAQLTPTERWQVIHYIRGLQGMLPDSLSADRTARPGGPR